MNPTPHIPAFLTFPGLSSQSGFDLGHIRVTSSRTARRFRPSLPTLQPNRQAIRFIPAATAAPSPRSRVTPPSAAFSEKAAPKPPLSKQALDSLVDTLLLFVRDTDRGARATETERENIQAIINEIITQCPQPDLSALPTHPTSLFDNYAVVYSANSNIQKSPSVGGMLRSPLGRILFRTRAIFEHFVAPNVVVNLLCFRFLGLLDGAVGLKGSFSIVPPPPPRTPLTPPSTQVCLQFQQPRLRIGPAVFQYGPCPRIATTVRYVDERVRINIGKRGSLFVFERRRPMTAMPEADEWRPLFEARPWPTFVLPLGIVSIGLFSLLAPLIVSLAGVALAVAIGFILKRGGTGRDPSNVDGEGRMRIAKA